MGERIKILGRFVIGGEDCQLLVEFTTGRVGSGTTLGVCKVIAALAKVLLGSTFSTNLYEKHVNRFSPGSRYIGFPLVNRDKFMNEKCPCDALVT